MPATRSETYDWRVIKASVRAVRVIVFDDEFFVYHGSGGVSVDTFGKFVRMGSVSGPFKLDDPRFREPARDERKELPQWRLASATN